MFELDLSLFSMAAEAPAEPVPEGEANEVCYMTRDTNNLIHIDQNLRLRKKKFFLLHAWISLDSP